MEKESASNHRYVDERIFYYHKWRWIEEYICEILGASIKILTGHLAPSSYDFSRDNLLERMF